MSAYHISDGQEPLHHDHTTVVLGGVGLACKPLCYLGDRGYTKSRVYAGRSPVCCLKRSTIVLTIHSSESAMVYTKIACLSSTWYLGSDLNVFLFCPADLFKYFGPAVLSGLTNVLGSLAEAFVWHENVNTTSISKLLLPTSLFPRLAPTR